MKKLFLHIGHEKTGTTSIQKYLCNNEDKLLKKGILYPKTGREGLAHFGLVQSIIATTEYRNLEFIKDPDRFQLSVWDELAAEISIFNGSHIIISAEHFFSRLSENSIDLLKKQLSKISNVETNILCYLRRQDELLEPSFSTSIKSGFPKTPEFWIQKALTKDRHFDYYAVLAKWENVFGRNIIRVRPFDKELREYGLFKDFFETVLEFGPTIDLEKGLCYHENKSLNPVAALVGFEINKRLPDIEYSTNTRLIAKLNEVISNMPEYKKYEDVSMIDFESKKKIYNLYELDNRKLFNKYNAPRYFSDPKPSSRSIKSINCLDINEALIAILIATLDKFK